MSWKFELPLNMGWIRSSVDKDGNKTLRQRTQSSSKSLHQNHSEWCTQRFQIQIPFEQDFIQPPKMY